MPLDRFVPPVDPRAVVPALGAVVQLLGLVLGVPAVVAVLAGEYGQAVWFAAPAVACGIGGAVARHRGKNDLELGDALLVAAGAYALFAGVGAIPLLPFAGPIDAFFEAMSGFTTTGLSALDVDDLPASVLFYRSWAQWVGGGGIVAVSLAILMEPGTTARRLYAAEPGSHGTVVRVLAAARSILLVYVGLTALGWLGYAVGGIPIFDAGLHALSTVSTGGFSSRGAGFADFGFVARSVATAVMLASAVTLPLYLTVWSEGPRRFLGDLQVRVLVAAALVGGLILWLAPGPSGPGQAAFHAVSAVSTTGYSVTGPDTWSDGEKLWTAALMAVGGPTGSSAGGMKLYRLVLLALTARWMVLRSFLPSEAKVPLRYGALVVPETEIFEVLGFVTAYLGMLVAGALVLALGGIPGVDALFESASAIGTVGLTAVPDAPWWARIVLSIEMWAGRLEVLPVLVIAYRVGRLRWWRKREGDHRRDG